MKPGIAGYRSYHICPVCGKTFYVTCRIEKWDTIIFLDGDTENFSPDNMMVTKAGLYTGMKRRGELTDVPEITKAYLALSLLRHEANKKQQ